MNPALRYALQWWVKALQNGVPKLVPYTFRADQLFITMSDGEGSAQVAVALWRPGSRIAPRITATTVPEDIQQLWQRQKRQTIAEIEAWAPLMALATWAQLSHGRWIHFVDKKNAFNTLINGSSGVTSLNAINHEIWPHGSSKGQSGCTLKITHSMHRAEVTSLTRSMWDGSGTGQWCPVLL